MADKFRGHHIVCTSLYEGKGYSGAFCENMTAVVERLRKDPDEELLLVAEPDMICANCPNRTEMNECVHNHNRVVNKDRRSSNSSDSRRTGSIHTARCADTHARR